MRVPRAAVTALFALLPPGCSARDLGSRAQTLASQTTFAHVGFGAGPAVFSDAGGHVLEERRYEPFGAPIDARVAGGIQTPDFVARDLNSLNKRTEVTTGWSDHGARWLVPETARWVSPDPPVEGPKAKFMFEPWALHPYQYVEQNPIAYWDPDGRDPDDIEMIKKGAENALVPGHGQIDGIELALKPLTSKSVPTAVKIAYGIISPPIIFVAGVGSEAVHVAVGIGQITYGAGRWLVHKILPSHAPPMSVPIVDLNQNDEPVSMDMRWTTHNDPAPEVYGPPTPRSLAHHHHKHVTPRPSSPPTHTDCWTSGPPR